MKARLLIAATGYALVGLATVTYAQSGAEGRMTQMKQKLAAACAGKTADTACSFTRRDGKTEDGTCVNVQSGSESQLLCMSQRMKKRMSGGGVGGAMHTLMHSL